MTRIRPRRWKLEAAVCAALLLVGAGVLWAGDDPTPPCSRVIAIADMHGGFDEFLTILGETGLIDAERRWSGGDACLVQLGDVTDRGTESRKILDLLIALEEQAAGRVIPLLGNHEVMNLIGDLRYVHPGEYTAFAADETIEERAAGFEAFQQIKGLHVERGKDARSAFDSVFPPGYFAHRRAFSADGVYGSWLLGLRGAAVLANTLFVHGGFGPEDAESGIDRVNKLLREELRDYLALREQLIDAGWLHPLLPYRQASEMVDEGVLAAMERDPQQVDQNDLEAARRFLRWYTESTYSRASGPLWNRDLAQAPEAEYRSKLYRTLLSLGVGRIVVGHTPTKDGRIAERFGDLVFVIDTGAGPAYDGGPAALEIDADGSVAGIYPGEVVELAEPLFSDAQLEAFFTSAEIVESEEIGVGITKPLRLTLEQGDLRLQAAFKFVDEFKPGITRFQAGAEMNFRDSYTFERAAYLLDRRLALGSVPVAVIRNHQGEAGAVVQWVVDSIDEEERLEQGLTPPDPRTLIEQRAVMKVWDVLIGNTDRNLGNQLYTTADWKLHLIDHSRCFRLGKKLPPRFLQEPVSIPRELLPRLEALDAKDLQRRLEGLLSKAQISAMLARRDRILKKIESDVAEYGEAMVFF